MLDVRPGIDLESLAVHDDEVVLASTTEVFRLPLGPTGAGRHAVLVRALPALRARLPVALAAPRFVGLMPDRQTPFTAERRLPGAPVLELPALALPAIAMGQLAGVVAGLAAVPAREARQWGVPGEGEVLVHGALAHAALLADPASGLLTGVTGWRLRLGEEGDGLHPVLRDLLA